MACKLIGVVATRNEYAVQLVYHLHRLGSLIYFQRQLARVIILKTSPAIAELHQTPNAIYGCRIFLIDQLLRVVPQHYLVVIITAATHSHGQHHHCAHRKKDTFLHHFH